MFNTLDPEQLDAMRTLMRDQASAITGLEKQVERLQAELRLYKKQKFQTRSEKYPNHPDLFEHELFNEKSSLLTKLMKSLRLR